MLKFDTDVVIDATDEGEIPPLHQANSVMAGSIEPVESSGRAIGGVGRPAPNRHPAPSMVTASARQVATNGLQSNLCGSGLIRVCHVSMTLATGGLERLLVEFSRLHDRDRFQLQFAALGELGTPAREIESCGCNVSSMQFGRVGKLQTLWGLVRHFRRSQVEIVHTHNTYAHFYGTLAARVAGVPVVVNTQHGRGCGPTWRNRLQFRLANLGTQSIVGVSDDSAALCRREDRRAAERVLRIWNGIDLDRFEFRGAAPSGDQPTAISVARLSPEKDFATLLRAVAEVVREVPEFRLHIVGDGAEKQNLERLTKLLRLDRHVVFLGERSDVPALLKDAGFFVSSSRTEGVSLTLLEAAAVGLPIVTTAVGGSPEVVQEGRTGFLVAAEQPSALAHAILRMCRSRARWTEMGRLGRDHVERHFEVSRMVRAYESLYEDLLRARR
ncbi:MAG: glycosyltransferase [Planctomycetaceae bacterium]